LNRRKKCPKLKAWGIHYSYGTEHLEINIISAFLYDFFNLGRIN